jgi:sporulation protein YlmC with PRC-barrel domain
MTVIPKQEIQLELLLGRRVFGINGRAVGHLEEVRATLRAGACFVEEYHVGSYAVFERLAALSIGRAILKLFGATKKHEGYIVPWDRLDLTDPEHPRLLCSVNDLRELHD